MSQRVDVPRVARALGTALGPELLYVSAFGFPHNSHRGFRIRVCILFHYCFQSLNDFAETRSPPRTPQRGPADLARAAWSGGSARVHTYLQSRSHCSESRSDAGRVVPDCCVGAGITAKGRLARLGSCEEPRPRRALYVILAYSKVSSKSSLCTDVQAPLDRM